MSWGLETSLSEGDGNVTQFAWAPDSEWVSYGDTGTPAVHIHSSGSWSFETSLGAPSTIQSLAWSPESYISYGPFDDGLRVHTIGGSWPEISESPLTLASDTVSSISWKPDESLVSYGSEDNNVYIQETGGSWPEISASPLTQADGGVSSLSWALNGDHLAYGSGDSNVYIHEASGSWPEISESPLTQATDTIVDVLWSDDGTKFGYASNDSNVYIHDVGDGWDLDTTITDSPDSLQWADWVDDDFLAYGNNNNDVYVHEYGGSWPQIDESPLTEATDITRDGEFAPNSDWLGYTSDTSDSNEAYIHNLPLTAERTVSGQMRPFVGRSTIQLTVNGYLGPISGNSTLAQLASGTVSKHIGSASRQAAPDGTAWFVGSIRVDAQIGGQPTLTRGESLTIGLYVDAEQRYDDLREYLDYQSGIDVTTLTGGDVAVFETLSDSAPVESLIVRVEPGNDVAHVEPFWAAIVGGTDQSVVVDTDARNNYLAVDFEMVYLAPAVEYRTRDDLLDDLGTPINQL